jgi:hypothetical protein
VGARASGQSALVGHGWRDPDRILDALSFEVLVDLGIGETRVGAEIDARDLALIARHDRLQHALPLIGAL